MSKPANVVCDGDVCYVVKDGAAPADQIASAGSSILQLLGDSLVGKDGVSVPTSSIAGINKVVALYFSAHWCPPCRNFTPKLAKIFTEFKQAHARKDDFNVVFVSSDRDEASFQDYFGDMPWLALPYDKRELKAKLSSKFKVQGIPSLIILDGNTGSIINADGPQAVLADPEGVDFPWRPPTYADVMSGAELMDGSGRLLKAQETLRGKVKLIYFSAHWCGPCRGFTPELVTCYRKLKAAGKNVEVVFVSGDRDEEGFNEYFGSMPWMALNFADKASNAKLNSVFNVEGIPTLVVVDEDDKVVTVNGRGAVSADPEGHEFPWHPKPLEQLSGMTVDTVNSGPVMMMYVDTSEEAVAKATAQKVLEQLAASSKAAAAAGQQEQDISFLWGLLGDGLMQRVLQFAGVEAKEGGGDGLFILDIPEQGVYRDVEAGSVSAEAAGKLLQGYISGSLTKVQLE